MREYLRPKVKVRLNENKTKKIFFFFHHGVKKLAEIVAKLAQKQSLFCPTICRRCTVLPPKTYGLKERNHHDRKERCRFIFSKVLGIDKKTVANTLRVFLAKFIEGLVSLVP